MPLPVQLPALALLPAMAVGERVRVQCGRGCGGAGSRGSTGLPSLRLLHLPAQHKSPAAVSRRNDRRGAARGEAQDAVGSRRERVHAVAHC